MHTNDTPTPAVTAAGSDTTRPAPAKRKRLQLAEWARRDLDFAREEMRTLMSDRVTLAAMIVASAIVAGLMALPFLTVGY